MFESLARRPVLTTENNPPEDAAKRTLYASYKWWIDPIPGVHNH